MRALRRALLVLTVVASALAGLTLPSSAQTGPAAPTGTAASCTGTPEVLLLIDQSMSLESTDPDNLRVTGAETLVRSLAASAQASDGSVEVTVAGFGSAVTETGSATLPGETDRALGLIGGFADASDDLNTDYVDALTYASRFFAEMPNVSSACKRLVWFTDGAYSIDELTPAVAAYTGTERTDEVRQELGGQICGPLPGATRLVAPVAEQVRAAGLTVQMIDLRAQGSESSQARAERAETAPVIDRMLGGDVSDPCTVPGSRVEASAAGALAAEFFAQGQIALGRLPLECGSLSSGYPASLVKALTVRSSDNDASVEVLVDGSTVAEGQGFASWSARDAASTAGNLTVRSSAGTIDGCFADLEGSVVVQGNTGVFKDATSNRINLAVGGDGSTEPGHGVGPEAVALSVEVDGRPVDAAWDASSRSWVVEVPGPRTEAPAVSARATAVGWSSDDELARLDTSIELLSEPPLPAVAWRGATAIEGASSVQDKLEVTPAAATGGQICVSFPEAATTTPESVRFEVDPGPHCAPDDEPFTIDATLATTSSTNAAGEVALRYTATYSATGNSATIDLGAGDAVVAPLSLSKPADTGRTAAVTGLLLAASLIITLGTLLVFTNRQRRMREPSSMQAAVVPIHRLEDALVRDSTEPLRANDLQPLGGSRRAYELPGDIRLRSSLTLNPFARIIVRARAGAGTVATAPGQTLHAARSVAVPAQFEELVIAEVRDDDSGEAVAIVPVGTSPAQAAALIDSALASLSGRFQTRAAALASPSSSSTPDAPGVAEDMAPPAPPASPPARPGRPARPGPPSSSDQRSPAAPSSRTAHRTSASGASTPTPSKPSGRTPPPRPRS